MSYLRWSFSKWYCYWFASEEKEKSKQILCVQCVRDFTYAELKEDIASCLNQCRDLKTGLEEKDYLELDEAMQAFIEDVERGNEFI